MNVHCPDCHQAVTVAPSAREGRCFGCRPVRRHSRPRRRSLREQSEKDFRDFLDRHATQ